MYVLHPESLIVHSVLWRPVRSALALTVYVVKPTPAYILIRRFTTTEIQMIIKCIKNTSQRIKAVIKQMPLEMVRTVKKWTVQCWPSCGEELSGWNVN